jgi:DNA-directed RNA polymerase alpha subunit
MSNSNAKILSKEEVLDSPVTAFPFSVRAFKIFGTQGVKTTRDLVDTDAREWLFSFRCDKKTLGGIIAFLGMMGLEMKNGGSLFSDEVIEGHIASICGSLA